MGNHAEAARRYLDAMQRETEHIRALLHPPKGDTFMGKPIIRANKEKVK